MEVRGRPLVQMSTAPGGLLQTPYDQSGPVSVKGHIGQNVNSHGSRQEGLTQEDRPATANNSYSIRYGEGR